MYYLTITPTLRTAQGSPVTLAPVCYEIPDSFMEAGGIDWPRTDYTQLTQHLLNMPVSPAWNAATISFHCKVSNEETPRPKRGWTPSEIAAELERQDNEMRERDTPK